MGFLSDFLSALSSAGDSTATESGTPSPESDFEAVVNEVAANSYGVASVSFLGKGSVEVKFYSRSRKSTWPAHYKFDLSSGDFTCHATYRDSTEIRIFGKEVQVRIRRL